MTNTAVVTAKGREILVGRMTGATPTQAEPKYAGLDLGTSTASTTDVAPFALAAEALIASTPSVTTTTTPNDTAVWTASFTIGGATEAIGGCYLSDSGTKPWTGTVTGGTVVGSTTGTTMTVSTSYTPANGTSIQVRGEPMTVTAGTGTTSLTVTRGASPISTIAVNDPVVAGNAAGSGASTITGGSLLTHSSWPLALSLNSGDGFIVTQTVHFT